MLHDHLTCFLQTDENANYGYDDALLDLVRDLADREVAAANEITMVLDATDMAMRFGIGSVGEKPGAHKTLWLIAVYVMH